MPVVATILAIVVGFTWVLLNKGGDAHHPSRYGQIDIPGSKTVVLPAGSLDLILESPNNGVGADVPPGLTASVTAVTTDRPVPKITRDVGGEYGLTGYTIINTPFDYHYRRVWQVTIPTPGQYVVRTGPPGYANPHNFLLDIGHAPSAGDIQIWERVGIAWLALILLWVAGRFAVSVRSGDRRATEGRLSDRGN